MKTAELKVLPVTVLKPAQYNPRKKLKHGRLLFTADYTDMENLVTWLMTFGAKAEVLEPAEARDIISRNAKETLQLYEGD